MHFVDFIELGDSFLVVHCNVLHGVTVAAHHPFGRGESWLLVIVAQLYFHNFDLLLGLENFKLATGELTLRLREFGHGEFKFLNLDPILSRVLAEVAFIAMRKNLAQFDDIQVFFVLLGFPLL